MNRTRGQYLEGISCLFQGTVLSYSCKNRKKHQTPFGNSNLSALHKLPEFYAQLYLLSAHFQLHPLTLVRHQAWSVLLSQYYLGDKIEKIEMGGACSTYGDKRGVYKVLVGQREGKRPLGRPRIRWEDNFKMDLQEVSCGGVWTGSSWLRIGTGGVHLWMR